MYIIVPMSNQGYRFISPSYADIKPFIIVDEKPVIEREANLLLNERKFNFFGGRGHLNMGKRLLKSVIEMITKSNR